MALTRQQLVDHCLAFPAAYEDYPFDRPDAPGAWTVMRHESNRRSFALIYDRGAGLRVNLKCDPAEAIALRQVFEGVTPAYHMNKTHWNTVAVDSDVPTDELLWQIAHSYDLIKPRPRAVNPRGPRTPRSPAGRSSLPPR
ncbi:MAG: MmcQ/YjbR family DNA-binding protein [Bifidobacteriaceae bacterium]|jgi:predicted DNA-binding protein (MmcQ/YjbR family)|nr:MmcQ/YjbR family DNA-binding protein [Bifidobacteriaceae bacterium]